MSCPVTLCPSSRSSVLPLPAPFEMASLYLEKNSLLYLKRENADLEELVAENERDSEVAWIETSSPYFERQVRALVNAAQKFSFDLGLEMITDL